MSKVYEIVTQQILEQLERGVVPWARPWKVDGLAPANLVTRRAYRGINVFLLGLRAAATPWWLTFRQAKELGGRVRAGATGFATANTDTLIPPWSATRRSGG